MKLVECTHLKVGYNSNTILEDVNLEIVNGDYIVLVGKNGSGKSTLLKTLLHLTPPLGGKVRYDRTIAKSSMGYLPQDVIVSSDFPATVFEIVLSGCANRLGYRPFYSKEEKEIANRYIKLLEISDIKNKSYRKLSGGQKQRILLARALCATEKILFLDEPFNGLDTFVSQQLYEVLERINKEYGVTIVMISHNISDALAHVNKIIHIDKTIVFSGSPKEYAESEIGKEFLRGEE